jgi:hypothetical protein
LKRIACTAWPGDERKGGSLQDPVYTDGNTSYCGSTTPERATLLRLDMEGCAQVLWRKKRSSFIWGAFAGPTAPRLFGTGSKQQSVDGRGLLRAVIELELWVLVAGLFDSWFFLAGIPEDLEGLDKIKEYPIGLKIFMQ